MDEKTVTVEKPEEKADEMNKEQIEDKSKEEEKTEDTGAFTDSGGTDEPEPPASEPDDQEPPASEPDDQEPPASEPDDQLNEQCAQIRNEVLEMTDEIKALEDSVEHLETLKDTFPDDKEIVRIQEQAENKIDEIKQAARDRIGDLKRCDVGSGKEEDKTLTKNNNNL